MKFDFHFGRKKITTKQWLKYSIVTSALALTLSYCGTNFLRSNKHAPFIREIICEAVFRIPNQSWSRFLHALCEASKDGTISEKDARIILDRTRIAPTYQDRDPINLERRAKTEVSYAIDRWKAKNPAPQINQELRRKHPTLTDTQLCVLSQAERYEEGDAIGIRYVGMGVCE